jgi:hypothetical protein
MDIKPILENSHFKKALPTLAFYIIAYFAIELLNKFSPGGPCVPGLGFLLFMLLIPVGSGWLLYLLYKIYKGDKTCRTPAMIHFGMLVILMILLSR